MSGGFTPCQDTVSEWWFYTMSVTEAIFTAKTCLVGFLYKKVQRTVLVCQKMICALTVIKKSPVNRDATLDCKKA